MKVKYLRDVTWPREQAGKCDDVKDLPDAIARQLLKGGFVTQIFTVSKKKKKEQTDGNTDERTDSASR